MQSQPEYDPAVAQTQLDTIHDIASNIEDKIGDGLIASLADVEKVCNDIKSTYLGTAGITLDEIDKICSKIVDKIQTGLQVKMTDVYKYMHMAGFPVPTLEQVQYANATGDHLGAMGYMPTLPGGTGGTAPVPSGPMPRPLVPLVPTPALPHPRPVMPHPVPIPPPAPFVPAPVLPPIQPPAIPPVQPIQPAPVGAIPPGMPGPITQMGGPGMICVDQQPGGPRVCYPGPTLPVINPNGPAPYGYMPGTGIPVANTGGTCPIFGQTDCGPMPAVPPLGSIATTNTFGETVPACPPGTHPVTKPGGPPTLTNIPTIINVLPIATITGQTCPNNVSLPPADQYPPGGSISMGGSPYFVPYLYSDSTALPDRPGGWDIVTIRQWSITNVGGSLVNMTYAVPHGYVIFSDPETTFLVAGPTVPGWGCGMMESERKTMMPGTVTVCEPDFAPPTWEQCALPAPLDCPKPYKTPTIPTGSGDDPCAAISQSLDNLSSGTPSVADIITFLGNTSGASSGTAELVLRAIMGSNEPVLPSLVKRFSAWADKLIKDASQGFNCDRSKLVPLATLKAAFAFVQKWTDIIPDQLLTELRQLSNTACQSELPSASEADRGWLADAITDDEWECFTKAEGKFVSPAKKLRDGERAKPTIAEIVRLVMREDITDQEGQDRLRALGVIKEEDMHSFFDLAKQFPTFSELIRFMVRDVFNEQVVTDGKLDNGFEQNYTEAAKKYGKAAGVSDELAKYFWRAHWQIPSFTMLREMLFRLRPDEYGPDLAVTQDTVKKALIQDDWAPGFVERMIEISYHAITRTDSILMYMMHTIDDDKFIGLLMSDGYRESDARTLQKHYKVKRRIADYLKAGYPTLKQAVTLYSRCMIDGTTLNDIIGKLATSDDQAADALEAADVARSVWERKQTVATIQREFRLGLLSDTEATSQLSERGIDAACVPGLVRRMRSNRQRASKYLSASQLCKMRKNGIITDMEQLQALVRQGWDSSDASRIVAQCDLDNANSAAKDREKQATAAAKRAQKEATAAAKAAKSKTGSTP